MRTTLDIDRDLLERLREDAHEQRVSFKDLVNRVLRRGLEAPAPDSGPYRCPTFAMGQPRQPIEKALALADALEDEEIARKQALRK